MNDSEYKNTNSPFRKVSYSDTIQKWRILKASNINNEHLPKTDSRTSTIQRSEVFNKSKIYQRKTPIKIPQSKRRITVNDLHIHIDFKHTRNKSNGVSSKMGLTQEI
jgi:hypothetical protein